MPGRTQPTRMATTIPELSAFLDQHDVRHHAADDETIVTGFGKLAAYRDGEGEAHIQVVIRLEEDGRYVKVFAPRAYVIELDDAGPVLQACAMIQWRTKLVQFEYDESDGELRPIVEFPLMDAPMTADQLMRCVTGLVGLVDHYHPVIAQARDAGEIAFPGEDETATDIDRLSRLLGGFSPEVLAEAVRRADLHRRRN